MRKHISINVNACDEYTICICMFLFNRRISIQSVRIRNNKNHLIILFLFDFPRTILLLSHLLYSIILIFHLKCTFFNTNINQSTTKSNKTELLTYKRNIQRRVHEPVYNTETVNMTR